MRGQTAKKLNRLVSKMGVPVEHRTSSLRRIKRDWRLTPHNIRPHFMKYLELSAFVAEHGVPFENIDKTLHSLRQHWELIPRSKRGEFRDFLQNVLDGSLKLEASHE